MGEYADMVRDEEYLYRETGPYPDCGVGPTTRWQRFRAWVHHLVWVEKRVGEDIRMWVVPAAVVVIFVAVGAAITILGEVWQRRCEHENRDVAEQARSTEQCADACALIEGGQPYFKGEVVCDGFGEPRWIRQRECWCAGDNAYQNVTDFVW